MNEPKAMFSLVDIPNCPHCQRQHTDLFWRPQDDTLWLPCGATVKTQSLADGRQELDLKLLPSLSGIIA